MYWVAKSLLPEKGYLKLSSSDCMYLHTCYILASFNILFSYSYVVILLVHTFPFKNMCIPNILGFLELVQRLKAFEIRRPTYIESSKAKWDDVRCAISAGFSDGMSTRSHILGEL